MPYDMKKIGGAAQGSVEGYIDKKRQLKRQAKGLGDIYGNNQKGSTGANNGNKRAKYDISGIMGDL